MTINSKILRFIKSLIGPSMVFLFMMLLYSLFCAGPASLLLYPLTILVIFIIWLISLTKYRFISHRLTLKFIDITLIFLGFLIVYKFHSPLNPDLSIRKEIRRAINATNNYDNLDLNHLICGDSGEKTAAFRKYEDFLPNFKDLKMYSIAYIDCEDIYQSDCDTLKLYGLIYTIDSIWTNNKNLHVNIYQDSLYQFQEIFKNDTIQFNSPKFGIPTNFHEFSKYETNLQGGSSWGSITGSGYYDFYMKFEDFTVFIDYKQDIVNTKFYRLLYYYLKLTKKTTHNKM